MACNTNSNFEAIQSLKKLGDLYLQLNRIEEAIQYYELADSLYTEITDLFAYIDMVLKLSDLHFQIGASDKGEYYLEKARKIAIHMKQESEQLSDNNYLSPEPAVFYEDEIPASFDLIYQIGGTNGSGEEIYVLLKLPYNLYTSLKTLVDRYMSFNPSHYGELIASGYGDPNPRLLAAISFIHNVASVNVLDSEVNKLNPKNAENFLQRGYTYAIRGSYSSAQSDLEKAIELEPDNPMAYVHYGQLLYELKEYENACMYFTQAIKLDSEKPLYFSRRGQSRLSLNEFESAREDFERAVALNPNDAWNHSWLGQSLIQIRELDLANNEFNLAIRLLPWESSFFRWRSIVHTERLNYTAARDDIQAALELAPKDVLNYAQQTILELIQTSYETALVSATQAVALNPDHSDSHYWQALALLGTGQTELARQSLKRSMVNLETIELASTKFWLGIIEIVEQSQEQFTKEKWHELHTMTFSIENHFQKQRLLARLSLFDKKASALQIYDDILNASYGNLRVQLIYLRLLSHLLPFRKDIVDIAYLFEKVMLDSPNAPAG